MKKKKQMGESWAFLLNYVYLNGKIGKAFKIGHAEGPGAVNSGGGLIGVR
jgi:hypothetical protein